MKIGGEAEVIVVVAVLEAAVVAHLSDTVLVLFDEKLKY